MKKVFNFVSHINPLLYEAQFSQKRPNVRNSAALKLQISLSSKIVIRNIFRYDEYLMKLKQNIF